MHLEAKTPQECEFLTTSLESYFDVWRELEKTSQDKPDELTKVSREIQEIADMLHKVYQYHEAYPETKGKSFYAKLEKNEIEHLLQSFNVLTQLNKYALSDEYNLLIESYREKANQFICDFCDVVYDEEMVRSIFSSYRFELKEYCINSVKQHVKTGNEPVYIFALHTFPAHHYQLATMNSVKSLHSMSEDNGFKEVVNDGYESELYNPACFDIECQTSDEYEEAEDQVKELHTQFFELTGGYSGDSYQKGSQEYQQIKKLIALADELFISVSIEVLQQVDFSQLNRSDNFCAIVASHEFSEQDFYAYAKQTIPVKDFFSIFPSAGS